MREIGQVKLVQLQPAGLIIDTPAGYLYDASRRLEVDRLLITELGIEATNEDGRHVLDIHHLSHPDKAYDDDDLVCIGFTPHYKAMRGQFGAHMVDGIAGENIIIETDDEPWRPDLGQGIAIENQETGSRTLLDMISYASPCQEFSHFAMKSQNRPLLAKELKSTLQFLDKGRRGFLLVMRKGQETAVVRPGDRIFTFGGDQL